MSISNKEMRIDVNFAKDLSEGKISIGTIGSTITLTPMKNKASVGSELKVKDVDTTKKINLNFNHIESVEMLIEHLSYVKENLRTRDYHNQLAYCC